MKNAVIYARYSSDKQDEASIDAQVRACREYAASKGYAVLEVYADEAVSGKGSKTASRKAYQKLLRDVNKGRFDTILIHKYDRVARNLGEHVNLEKKLKDRAVELIAVAQDFGSSAEAKIMKTLMWSLSEYYLDNLSSETKKGHRETAMKAKHNGGYAPFGYDVVNQEYVVNELEAGYVRKIFDAAANREGFTAIIEELATAGITGKRGKPIKYTQIYEMLRNEKYTGTYIYTPQEEERREDRRSKPNAIRIENALPQIISKAQFMEVQRIMTERKQTGKRNEHNLLHSRYGGVHDIGTVAAYHLRGDCCGAGIGGGNRVFDRTGQRTAKNENARSPGLQRSGPRWRPALRPPWRWYISAERRSISGPYGSVRWRRHSFQSLRSEPGGSRPGDFHARCQSTNNLRPCGGNASGTKPGGNRHGGHGPVCGLLQPAPGQLRQREQRRRTTGPHHRPPPGHSPL